MIDVLMVVLAILVCMVFFGFFWGRLWNKVWGFSFMGSTIFSLVSTAIVGGLLLAKGGCDNAVSWLDLQRDEITESLTESGSLNRQIFKEAWSGLRQSQEGLTPAEQGGQRLNIINQKAAELLAEKAATIVRLELLKQTPFEIGAPFLLKDPKIVAKQVVEVVSYTYPVTVTPVNELTRLSIVSQIDASIEHASSKLRDSMSDLSKSLFWLIIMTMIAQLIWIQRASLNDIKINPKI